MKDVGGEKVYCILHGTAIFCRILVCGGFWILKLATASLTEDVNQKIIWFTHFCVLWQVYDSQNSSMESLPYRHQHLAIWKENDPDGFFVCVTLEVVGFLSTRLS